MQGSKGKMMLQSESQAITGLVLNFKVNVARQKRQEVLRDSVQVLKTGLPFDDKTRGRLGWINSANRQAASRLMKAAKQTRLAPMRKNESAPLRRS